MSSVYVTTWFRELGIVLCETQEETIRWPARCGVPVYCPEKGNEVVPARDVHDSLESAQEQVDRWIANEASHG